MSAIQIKDSQFKLYISREKIEATIKSMAAKINEDFVGKKPLFVAVLNGSFIFAADLFKELDLECEISFIKLASYRGTKSTGNILSLIGLDEDITHRHVVILEDIIDSGNTMSVLLPKFQNLNPASVSIAAFLLKPEALEHDIKIRYTGLEIPNEFIVGYGLDYDGFGRNYKDIYQLVE